MRACKIRIGCRKRKRNQTCWASEISPTFFKKENMWTTYKHTKGQIANTRSNEIGPIFYVLFLSLFLYKT